MSIVKRSVIYGMAIVVLTGCGGGGGEKESKKPVVKEKKELFDLFGSGVGITTPGVAIFNRNTLKGDTSTKYKINSLTANACKGTAIFNPSDFVAEANKTQEVQFSVAFKKFEKCITDRITFNYSILRDGVTIDFTKEILNPAYEQTSVFAQPGDDPLYKYQWHLKNTGQQVGVSTAAKEGNDINVEDVWKDNITGKGVTVAVIDFGVDMFHPDLKDNLLLDLSHNYHTGNLVKDGGINNTTPHRYKVIAPDDPNTEGEDEVTGGYRTKDWHGTSVAGIIAAKGWNGIGTRGVAPNAKLVSFNALETWVGKNDSEARQLFIAGKIPYIYHHSVLTHYRLVDSLTAHIDKIDIYNNSWGNDSMTLNYGISDINYENTLKYGIIHGRNGKGAIYIKSAGNGGTGAWTNFEPMQTNGYFIVVGASNADGNVSSYNTSGPNILVNAPGGGTSQAYVKPNIHEIVTTDMAGKERGYDSNIQYMSSTQHFNVRGNENYDYTQLMNGTSAAAPIVSGVVALMLEANPNLTWRDVRLILAKSAYKNDLDSSGWSMNAAGMWFSNDYGFGRVDAKAAVSMAKTFTSVGNYLNGFEIISIDGNNSNPQSSNGVVQATANVKENIKIEDVSVVLTIDQNSSNIQYKTTNYSGNGNAKKGPLRLLSGKNIFTISSRDTNTTTSVKLLKDEKTATDSDAIEVVSGLTDINTTKKVMDIPKDGNYYIIVNSNSTWDIKVESPISPANTGSIEIALTSPGGTRTLLARAPNALRNSSTYTRTRLSSVQFLDEDSKGKWTLDIKDIERNSFMLQGWKLKVRGHK